MPAVVDDERRRRRCATTTASSCVLWHVAVPAVRRRRVVFPLPAELWSQSVHTCHLPLSPEPPPPPPTACLQQERLLLLLNPQGLIECLLTSCTLKIYCKQKCQSTKRRAFCSMPLSKMELLRALLVRRTRLIGFQATK